MQIRALSLAVLSTLAVGSFASAAVFTDAQNENHDGNAHMDIAQVEVTNTASTITFTITARGSLVAPNDWGKYLVGIDTNPSTGDFAQAGNGWGRQIKMADGMDAYVGSWANGGGGAQAWTYNGTSWNMSVQNAVAISGNSTSFTFNLSDLGLSLNQTIRLDAYTTGDNSPNGANDASSNPLQASSGWDVPYATPTGTGHLYTIAIPEPATLGALAGAGLLALRRRK